MKYAYQITSAGDIILTSGESIIFWKELTQEEHSEYIDARHNKNQILYVDDSGNIQARDKLTIWDEATKSWIPDIKAIRDNANNEAVNLARQLYQSGNLDRHQFSKLSHDQQLELTKYLDDLLVIINCKELPDYEIYLPPKPEFLN